MRRWRRSSRLRAPVQRPDGTLEQRTRGTPQGGVVSPVPAMSQTAGTTNMDILRQKMKADKKLVVAQNLKLTDAEGTAFWPVYDAYQKDLQQINQRLTAVVAAYANAYNKGPVANDVAKSLLDEALAVDEAEARL